MRDKEKWVQTFDTCLYENMSEGKNKNQNRLELLNKRSKLAIEADSLNGKEFHI